MDVNLNSAECMKSATHWGETVYHNICKGTQSVVEWGLMDYILAVGLTAFLAAVVVALICMLYSIFTY